MGRSSTPHYTNTKVLSAGYGEETDGLFLWCGAHCLELIVGEHGLEVKKFQDIMDAKSGTQETIKYFKKSHKAGELARTIGKEQNVTVRAFSVLKTMKFVPHSHRQ